MREIPKVYNPKKIEEKWYPRWESAGYFTPDMSSNATPYCIVIPPPNVTGYLHMGHALQHTLMDVLIRWRRMQGYKTLWLPGTDHAGISTQVVVERQLVQEGLSRADLGRERFEKRVWEWKEHSGGTIQRQMRIEGASCDWTRERFTLDERLSRAVREVFVRLYEEGLIYRGEYIVNWCPRCQTSISDLEAPKEPVQGKLYYIAYPVDGTGERVVVATTRPETMLGDTGVAVNPADERYRKYHGKSAILPIIGRKLPFVTDEAVEMEFGTGVVKVTPAHDPNDFRIGNKHGLPLISVIDKTAVMTIEAGPQFAGLDRFEARKRVLEELERQSLLVRVEDYTHSVGHHDRCKTIVEPLVSTQWFMRMKGLAEEAIKAVEDRRTRFIPESWEKVYFDWLRNIQDWCISRQLWWGHRIPAWYCPNNHITVARQAPGACATCGSREISQDEDVLDTWFSSALWPFSTLGWPDDTEDLRTFYPTDVLVTGYDIIFFWVARMMMMGLKFAGDVPFRTVFVTNLVRDAEGQKMSKMKGNVIDPLEVFDRFGTDAVRCALAAAATWSSDIALQESKLETMRNFANKIWNASRFVLLNCDERVAPEWTQSEFAPFTVADRWIISRLNRAIADVTEALEGFRFHEAAQLLYHFFWDDFCDWYIELSKPLVTAKEESAAVQAARNRIVYVLETALRLLHPFMPFITEELWQRLPGARNRPSSICIAEFPKVDRSKIDAAVEREMDMIIEIITRVRNIRSEFNISPSQLIELWLEVKDKRSRSIIVENESHIKRLARVERIVPAEIVPPQIGRMAARSVAADVEIIIPLEGLVDIDKERTRLQKERDKLKKEAEGLLDRLNNPDFVARAPEDVVAANRQRFDDLKTRIKKLDEALDFWNAMSK